MEGFPSPVLKDDAIETTSPTSAPGTAPADEAGRHPLAADATDWLLAGRFFTVDARGAVTMWSPPAAEAFGWSRRDIVRESFVETLVAPADRAAQSDLLTKLLGAKGATSGYRTDSAALDPDGAELRAALVAVPIHVGTGYEFNGLLQEIARGKKRFGLPQRVPTHKQCKLMSRRQQAMRDLRANVSGRACQ